LLNINKISNKIIRDKIEVLCNEGVEKFIQILIDTETEKNNAKNAFTKAINEKNELEKENEILRKHVDKKLDIKNIEIDKLKKKCDKIEKEKAELLKKIKELEKYNLEKEKEKNTIIKTGNEKTKELEKELEKTNFQVKKLKNSMSKDVTTSN
jgi:predicted RNase H-like nuclease (RuvC/YqgF family)